MLINLYELVRIRMELKNHEVNQILFGMQLPMSRFAGHCWRFLGYLSRSIVQVAKLQHLSHGKLAHQKCLVYNRVSRRYCKT